MHPPICRDQLSQERRIRPHGLRIAHTSCPSTGRVLAWADRAIVTSARERPVDLVQHQIVFAVTARQQSVRRVMFKGGTLLRVCHRRDWRFSEDLDFDWIHADDTKPAMQDFFDRVVNTASRTYRTAFDTKWGANKLNIYWELPNATRDLTRIGARS